MRCFKLLGERIMARDFDRQVAELQVRAAVLNRLTRLGTPCYDPYAISASTERQTRLSLICATEPH
jgi:chromosome condensin MukBEF MukE localization factor